MPITIDHAEATEILLAAAEEAKLTPTCTAEKEWTPLIETLGNLCPPRKSATLIASLGVAVLAKAVNSGVNVYSLLTRGGGANDYSARSLADQVWAKNRARLNIDFGANGANPLNNTPFIGKASILEIKNVANKAGWKHFLACMERLKAVVSGETARAILRAFIRIRTKNTTALPALPKGAGDHLTATALTKVIDSFVRGKSEGGRRAQAVVAGLCDVAYGQNRVDTGRINDPSRKAPLDISIKSPSDDNAWSIALEVKDRPIGEAEVFSAVESASEKFGVPHVVMVAVNSKQSDLDPDELETWALGRGVQLLVYTDWPSFVVSCLLSAGEKAYLAGEAFRAITKRLQDLNVDRAGIKLWRGYSAPLQA
jgi:hypothetical protein